jgi:hypothetical protein
MAVIDEILDATDGCHEARRGQPVEQMPRDSVGVS